MEVVCDKPSDSAEDRGSPISGENMQPEANGTTAKSWKAKREDWIKPGDSKPSEDSVIDSGISASAANDSVHRIILDEDHVNGTGIHSPERKKSLPPIKVPDKSAELPVIVSRAVYNRYVLIAQKRSSCHIL